MDNFTILIVENKIFFEILKEIKLFSKYKIEYHDDLDFLSKNKNVENKLLVLFDNTFNKIIPNSLPRILITKSSTTTNKPLNILQEKLKMPFLILDFHEKIISLIAKNKFKKNSLINLKGYIIDRNERKIKKNNLELDLSEKEVNFLILFSESQGPIKRNFFLKNLWKYSESSETHTVETHIHRLRKKILEKFGDNNFIKNNDKGYYI